MATDMSTPAPGPLGIPEVWDAIASDYAKDVTPFFARFADEALRIAGVGPSFRVLDVASGPGTLTFLAAPRVAHVSAVDFSPKMIDEVKARAVRDGMGNVEATLMDAQALDFADATFDAAFCLFAFMFFPDRARAFREIRRVLRDGGKAIVATWAPIERRPFFKIAIDALAEAIPGLPPMPKGDLQAPQACIDEMSAAGFCEVSVHPFTSFVRIDSAHHYLEIMERSGAGFAAIRKKVGEAAWPDVKARMLESIARRIPEGGADFSAEALLSVGAR
jgi:ubiquinone/menaquinone biosynthesis C-methylase UbiE